MMRSLSIPFLLSVLVAVTTFFSSVQAGPVDLGAADSYAILAGTAVSSTGTAGTVVNGNIGISPSDGFTGFPPGLVNGQVNAGTGASALAQGSLTTAYNYVAAQPINATLSDQDLGGMILLPGVYKFAVAASLNGVLTLDANGSANAVWMFQVGTALTIAHDSKIYFKDSIGNADYVYWQVGSSVTLASGVPMIGNMLALTAITAGDGATVLGRCLARNAAVNLDKNQITVPPKVPTSVPTAAPSVVPSLNPSVNPTVTPSVSPSAVPSLSPSVNPTVVPSASPSMNPSAAPSVVPTMVPSAQPSLNPSVNPTVTPSLAPSASPTVTVSAGPTVADAPSPPPTLSPSVAPSVVPTMMPSADPSASPSASPSVTPSMSPSTAPSAAPSESPSVNPSAAPSTVPSTSPSVAPSTQPSETPSMNPSAAPSNAPSVVPTESPSASPSINPSAAPSTQPSEMPSVAPSVVPSAVPTVMPSANPSASPSVSPSAAPSHQPSVGPSTAPSASPSTQPSVAPSMNPSAHPSAGPSAAPSTQPSVAPSANPSVTPSAVPSVSPTVTESAGPTFVNQPTAPPSWSPSATPSAVPSVTPSAHPSVSPSVVPSAHPSASPSVIPTVTPSVQPTVQPSVIPSVSPSAMPSFTATSLPTFGELPIDLGLAEPYAILAGSTVTSTGVVGTIVTGDIGVSPGTAVTGFPPGILNGAIDSANGAAGGAKGSLTVAYDAVAARQFNRTLSNQDLGGMTLAPGVYKFEGAATMNGALTLDARGDPAAVWMFQIGSSLLIAEGSSILFKDSIGNPDLVYWQVGSSATLGPAVSVVGNFMAFASITVNTGATVKGRVLARNGAVTLDFNVITKPAVVAFTATQTVTGLSLEQFNADIVTNTNILKESVAKTMPGVLPSNIKNFEVTAGPTTAERSLFLRRTVARALAGSSIILKYDVVTSSTQTSEQLQTQLRNAVSDGSFDSFMQTAAAEQGSTSLQSATSDAIETETITPPDNNTDDDSGSNAGALSDGAIAGIVIGVVLGSAAIALLLFGLCGGFNSAPASVQAAEPAHDQRTYAEVAAAAPAETEMTSAPKTVTTADNEVAVAV